MLPASVAVSLASQGIAVALARRAPKALLVALSGGLVLDAAANIIAEMGHQNLYVINIALLFESILLPIALVQCCDFGKARLALIPLMVWPFAMYFNGVVSAPDRWFAIFAIAWLAIWSVAYMSLSVYSGRKVLDIGFALPAAIFIKVTASAVVMFYFSTMLKNDLNSVIVLWVIFNYATAVVNIWIGVSACISAPRSN